MVDSQIIVIVYKVQVPRWNKQTQEYEWGLHEYRNRWSDHVSPDLMEKAQRYARGKIGDYWTTTGRDGMDQIKECYAEVATA